MKRLVTSSAILLLIGNLLAYEMAEMPYFASPRSVVEDLLIALYGLEVLTLAGYAWVRRNPATKLLTTLTLAWSATIPLLTMTADQDGISEGLALIGLWTYLLVPGAYLRTRAMSTRAQLRRRAG